MLILQCVSAGILIFAFLGRGHLWAEIDDFYLFLNIVGGGGLTASAWAEGQWGFVLLFTIWTIAALRSFLSIRLAQNSKQR